LGCGHFEDFDVVQCCTILYNVVQRRNFRCRIPDVGMKVTRCTKYGEFKDVGRRARDDGLTRYDAEVSSND
jgi:hypothetical protein